ncbi:transcriptional regulator, partial [bacterium]
MTTVSHESWLLKFLSDPVNAAGYLDAAAEDDDPRYMLEALRR